MYGAELTEALGALRTTAQLLEEPYWILDSSLSCFLEAATAAMRGRVTPQADFVGTSVRLLILSDAVSRSSEQWGGVHYLLGLGYEQCAFVISTLSVARPLPEDPLGHDEWARLVVAVLHYLAGGYRVQAVAALRRLRDIGERAQAAPYLDAIAHLRALFDSRVLEGGGPRWRRILFQNLDLPDPVEAMLNRLARQVRAQRGIVLTQLGRDQPEQWLGQRGIDTDTGRAFWRRYISSLEERGIVSFTREQFGNGFDAWLQLQRDLLVVLPTGAGKSLIGELRTALTLAAGHSCVWLQPTRALVRQSQRELRRAFRPAGIEVEELPTTEDAAGLFTEDFDETGPVVATTTPERLSALLRSNPASIANVGLLVMDEAQLLCSEQRGVTAEQVLADVRQVSPDCRIVLMTAFADVLSTLQAVLGGLGQEPELLVSTHRPTRRVYGVLRAFQSEEQAELQVLVYPPRPNNAESTAIRPVIVHLPDRVHANERSAIDTAMRFATLATTGRLRTVVFVSQKRSTESQAETIARRNPQVSQLPGEIVSRLRLELGRPSALETVVPNAVAPHHAGLSTLEQHLIERLIAGRRVLTVVATPTLAQGVNLPIDVALVTFTQRHNATTDQMQDLTEAEVRNMLGRAGRASMVPDGLCLIVRKESSRTPAAELARERRWFFAQPQNQPAPGIVSLLRRARDAEVDVEDWINAMPNLRFSESQTLLSLVTRRLQQDAEMDIAEELSRYPSFRTLPIAEQGQLASVISALAANVAARLENQAAVIQVVARSGMPIPFVETILSEVSNVGNTDVLLDNDWWDDAIGRFFIEGAQYPWVAELSGPFQPAAVMNAVSVWRRGDPISLLESIAPADDERRTRIRTGEYLNHTLSLLAQLWAIAPLAVEALDLDVDPGGLRQFAVCVRDGVPDVDALIWLRALGGMDRVLATALSAEGLLPDTGGYYFRRRVATDLLNRWERRDEPSPLSGEHDRALRGLLDEGELLNLA